MDFQVNNETYFVNIAEEGRGWQVFVDTPNGPRPVAVYIDGPFGDTEFVVVENKSTRGIVN